MSVELSESFEPKVLGFACLYCAYAAADVAGVTGHHYPESVRLVKVPCTGLVSEIDLLKAFESGVDGVLLMGCLEGQCHHKEGNLRAKRTVAKVQSILDRIGMGSGRLECHWVSASMGSQFADIVTEAVNRFRAMGPSPAGTGSQRSPRQPASSETVRR